MSFSRWEEWKWRTDLKVRTRRFALRIIKLYAALPNTVEAQIIGKQLVRSGTSVGAHYREAQYAKSDPDFISKIQGALQELEETIYWLELVEDIQVFTDGRLAPIAIGLGLTLIHLISIPVTNTSVNPARSTGPAIFAAIGGQNWAVTQLWLFWVAPILGALLAGFVYEWLSSDDAPAPAAEAADDNEELADDE